MTPLSKDKQIKSKFNSTHKTMRTTEAEKYLNDIEKTLSTVLVGDVITCDLWYLCVDLLEKRFRLYFSYSHEKNALYCYDEKGKRYDRSETIELLKRYHKKIPSHILEMRKEKLRECIKNGSLKVV